MTSLFVLLVACGESDEARPGVQDPLPDAQTLEYRDCSVDEDCVVAQNGCCDCANGGEDIAVRADEVQEFRSRFDCGEASCTLLGSDPPCGCGFATCEAGQCTYHHSGPGCGTVDIACGENLGLTEADAVEIDGMGFEVTWDAESDGDHMLLTWSGLCGDECSETREVTFDDAYEECPTFVSARIVRNDAGAETSDWASTGTMRIQDWDIGAGPMAGRLESEISVTFYWPAP